MQATFRTLSAVALLGMLALIPSAVGVPGVAGTQVLIGESDWLIPAKGSSRPFLVVYSDQGVVGDPRDDCAILRTTASSSPGNAVYTASGTVPILNKDIRLTACRGLPAGTLITDADVTDKAATWTFDTDLHAVYGDVNSDGKYGKGDYLYLTTKTTTATAQNAADGMAATTDATSWTVRLTPAGDLPSMSFVRLGDADLASYKTAAQLVYPVDAANTLDAGVIQEKEDGQWVWAMHVSTTGVAAPLSTTMLAKGIIPPLDSVRLNTITPAVPDIRVTNINIATPEIQAGSKFTVIADLTNAGKLAGIGLVLSRLDGQIVDARATPLLGAGEKGSMLLTLTADQPGTQNLAVNDLFAVIEVTGEATSGGMADSASVAQLEAKIAALEARLASLESTASTDSSGIQVQGAAQNARSPGVEPLALLVILGALVYVRRRN
jgi:hypothetical protein